ncbi:TIGR02679 domain-containing protein [Brevibacillus sp. NPDC058079]|uniref:TIGR02679 domain-containing protein n=1 Tax=Brevibacillus sp. NPDC058079 TaxID=3346330 RepID=UPI0036DFA8A1
MDERTYKEAVEHFKQKGFLRLFLLFKEKIESLNAIGGTVKLIYPTEIEIEKIGRWLGIQYEAGKTMTVGLKKFEKRFEGTRFEGVSLWHLIECVQGAPLISKKERLKNEVKMRLAFFDSLKSKYPHDNVELVIEAVKNKITGTKIFTVLYNQESYGEVELLVKGIYLLPGKAERLSVFVERVTGNPHYFDGSQKLITTLELLRSLLECDEYRSELNVKEENELLAFFKLAKDDLHNFVTCYGLRAEKEGVDMLQWRYACEERSTQNISLREMMKISKVYPSVGKKVFILENSGVYSGLMDELKDNLVPLVCTHGEFKLSGILLVERLVESDCEIYYAGDLDVKGLQMAYRLKKKYSKHIHYWRMNKADYEHAVSDTSLLNKPHLLETIADEELNDLVKELQISGKAGFQEKLIPFYLEDINKQKK